MRRLAVLLTLVSCASPPIASTTTTSSASVAVTDAEGLPAERIQTMFAPAAEPVHRCVAGKGGKVTFRVDSRDGALHVTAVPDVMLDDASRACAIGALSEVYLTETGSNAGAPNIPPSGFTSLVTVTW